MPTVITVRVFFEAAHRLHNPDKSDEWNRRIYDKCNNPRGHGHNYAVDVSVEGEVDHESGYLIDMKVLKRLIGEAVIEDVDHSHLNHDVPWLDGIIPTAENLAHAFFDRIEPHLPRGIRLVGVTVHETERNSATYRR
jgi:6-pyruvoyltetrahydropterin/6-carboxytetrahydropterin synthase